MRHSSDPTVSATDKLMKEIQGYKEALAGEAAMKLVGMAIDFEPTKKKLAELEKRVAKAEKSAPGAALTACQLATARQTFTDAEDAKADIPRKGAVKAAERQMRMEVVCEEQIEAWTRKLEETKQRGIDRAILWDERRELLDSRGAEVLQLFVEQIRAAKTLAGEIAAVEVKAAVAVEPPKVAVAVEPPKPSAKDLAKLEAQKAFKKLDFTVKVVKEDLTDLSQPPPVAPADLPAMQTMWCWMRASALGDAQLPFSFAEMGATIQVAKQLVGQKVWEMFFDAAKLSSSEICPMQLRQLVFMQLTAYDASLRDQISAQAEKEAQHQWDEAGPRLAELKTLARPGPY